MSLVRTIEDLAKRIIEVKKCPCRFEKCSDYHLEGVGKFIQGSGFTKEEADFFAAAPKLVRGLRRKIEKLELLVDYHAKNSWEKHAENARLREALTMARSFILCGDEMTPEAEKVIDGALSGKPQNISKGE